MLTNKFVLSPTVSDELCVALATDTNGLTVVPCYRFESFLKTYKNDLENNLEYSFHKNSTFKSDMQKYLLNRGLWITLEGFMTINSHLRIRKTAIAFEANDKNMTALNMLYNNIYADLNLTIDEMIKEYPLTAFYLTISDKIWK